MFFYLGPERALLNDTCHKLMRFYYECTQNYDRIKSELIEIADRYNKNPVIPGQRFGSFWPGTKGYLFYELRDLFNTGNPLYSYATLYFFLNKTSFRGTLHFNKLGMCTSTWGRDRARVACESLSDAAISLLKTAELCCEDYAKILERVRATDFIFLDPPYYGTDNRYGTSKPFNETDHRNLATLFKRMTARALVCVQDSPLMRELYDGYIKSSYDIRYDLQSQVRSTTKQHLIITNY